MFPTPDFLRECLVVSQTTGRLSWKARPREHFKTAGQYMRFNREAVGTFADTALFPKNGYRRVRVSYRGRKFCLQAHRVVFAIVHGHWPLLEIDHINRVRADNRPCNLRDVSHTVNMNNKVTSRRAPVQRQLFPLPVA